MKRNKSAQSMIEFLILLATVTVVILVRFRRFLPEVGNEVNATFIGMSKQIMGNTTYVYNEAGNVVLVDKLRTYRHYP